MKQDKEISHSRPGASAPKYGPNKHLRQPTQKISHFPFEFALNL